MGLEYLPTFTIKINHSCRVNIPYIDVMGKFMYMTQPSWTTLAANDPRWRRGGSDAKAVANGAH